MIKGQLWKDSFWMDETGAAILVSGRLTAPDSMGGSIDLVGGIKFVDGASARVTGPKRTGRYREYPLGVDFGPRAMTPLPPLLAPAKIPAACQPWTAATEA
jgi:hypothetical protein